MSTAAAPPSLLPPDLQALRSSFLRSHAEIHSFQLPRLSACSTLAHLADYESEVNASLDGLKRTFTQLQLAIDDADTPSERNALAQTCSQLRQELDTTRQATRKALVSARRNVENARTLEARQGLQLAADSAKQRTGGRGGASSGEDKLVTKSQDVTDALRRTVTLMSAELEKSALSSSLLEESSQTLTTLSSQYGSLSTLMANSAHIIKTMEREDLIGKGMLVASMLFFIGCVGYILYVRLISRGFGIIAFFWRLFGFGRLLGSGRSADEVKNKIDLVRKGVEAASTTALGKMARQAVESLSPAVVGTAIATAAGTASTGSPTVGGEVEATPTIFDAQDVLEQDDELVRTVVPEDLYDGDRATLTRQHTLPTERVEL
ncbi:Protein transport protein sec20 [Thecaphora frezii]